jgi:hypothetical protein
MEDTEDGQQRRGHYRVTATIKADTAYELEVIRIDPITIFAEEPQGPPKRAA